MTSRTISRDYIPEIEARRAALRLLLDRERFDDVGGDAHECRSGFGGGVDARL